MKRDPSTLLQGTETIAIATTASIQILGSHQVVDYSTISGNNLGKGQLRMGHCTRL
jgi:hypothetical protein